MKSHLLALLALFTFYTQAAVYHWNGASQDWNTLSNWKVGTATDNASMLLLPDASAVPGASNTDIVNISYTTSTVVPKLSGTITLAAFNIVGSDKSLDLNGFNLTIVGLANTNNVLLCNLSQGSIINSSATSATLAFNPVLITNTRITTMTIGPSFVFGASVSDNLSLSISTNNSGSSISITNSTFNVPCTIITPNMTISGNTFNKNVSVTKGAGTGAATISYVSANNYYGRASFTVINAVNKSLKVGQSGTVSNFYGDRLAFANNYASNPQLSLENFVFHNPCEIASGGYENVATSFDFRANVTFSGSKLNMFNPKFGGIDATVVSGSGLVLSDGAFSNTVNFNVLGTTATIVHINSLVTSSGTLNLTSNPGKIYLNNVTVAPNLGLNVSGAGLITAGNCTFNANLNINNTGTGQNILTNCTYNTPLITFQGTGSNTLTGSTIANNILIKSSATAGTVSVNNFTFNGLANFENWGAGGMTVSTATTNMGLTLTNSGTGALTLQTNSICKEHVRLVSNSTGNIIFKGATCSKDLELTKSVSGGNINIGSMITADAVTILEGGGKLYTTPNAFEGTYVGIDNFTELGNDGNTSILGQANKNCAFIMRKVDFTDKFTAYGAVVIYGGGIFRNDVLLNFFYDIQPAFNKWENTYTDTEFMGNTTINITKGVIVAASNGSANYIFKDNTAINVCSTCDFVISRGHCVVYKDLTYNYASGWLPSSATNYAYHIGQLDYGILKFVGTGLQTLKANVNLRIGDLQINKQDGGRVTIDCPSLAIETTSGGTGTDPDKNIATLYLTKGILKIPSTTTLKLGHTSGDSRIVDGGHESYIDGKLRWNGFPSLHNVGGVHIPIGKDAVFAPISVDMDCKTAACKRDMLFEYFNPVSPTNTLPLSGINDISNCEYWTVNASGSNSFKVGLPWTPSNCTSFPVEGRTIAINSHESNNWINFPSTLTSGSTVSQGALSSNGSVVVTGSSSTLFNYNFKFGHICPPNFNNITQTLSISGSTESLCAGQPVLLTANSNISALNPIFKWMVNGTEVQNSTAVSYTSSTLQQGDVVTLTSTTTSSCVSNKSIGSNNTFTVSYSTEGQQAAHITNKPVYCISELPITLTSDLTGGSYSGTGVEGNVLTNVQAGVYTISYTYNGGVCAAAKTVTKNINVIDLIDPSVTLSTSPSTLCEGNPVTVSSISNISSLSPQYQWYINNVLTEANTAIYSSANLVDGDKIKLKVSSDNACVNSGSVTSDVLTFDMARLRIPSISIETSTNIPVTNGTSVNFNAEIPSWTSPSNIQWYKNGVLTPTTGISYTTTLQDQDMIMAVLNIGVNTTCVKGGSYSSNIIVNSSQQIYYDLHASLEGNYESVRDKKLFFKYKEKYVTGPSLKYSIKDKSNHALAGLSNLSKVIGDNYYVLDLSNVGGISVGSFYVLEVMDDKNNKGYLRFKIED